ncbi:methyltransferase domain-containing protein [Methylobacterium sp. WL69]|uniref:class I SAM-dependent methyltransferase n=1 Tax=Methylobacterium sp. WL69 TaxID=2603893 RepID=UPI0011C84457|nr:class I SAM-dependent methyltransferase [Methylobacterium sp. WL69]TXM72921.1 methyltransferase domain-containing protein [Methylobacterium sp. WL69]
MTDWSAGYVTEINYSFGFYRELSPSFLAFSALVRGTDEPSFNRERLRVLELGCGQGESAVIIAAARPEIDYVAIDFNPAHIAGASSLARKASIKNLTLREASFADIAADESFGQFDIITLHGIYTWVSEENREHILKIAHDKLCPGGLLYVSYNCHPGWTPVIPMRRLITDVADAMPRASVPDRIKAGLDILRKLAGTNVQAVAGISGLKERIERISAMPLNYVAHEYLNSHWTIFHSADVAVEMGRAKLSYVASANVWDVVDALNFTPEQQQLIVDQHDPSLRETLRDIITNQQFRRDIFIRGPIPLRGDEGRERWLDLRLALTTRAQDVPRKIKGPIGEVTLHAPTYDPVLEALSAGPCTMRDLISLPAIAALSSASLQQAITILIGMNVLAPALPVANEATRVKRTEVLNGVFLERARFSTDHNFLASPVIGAGVSVDRINQLILLSQRKKADPVHFMWGILSAQGQKLVKEGKALETEAENLSELEMRVASFNEKVAPVLKQLKVW